MENIVMSRGLPLVEYYDEMSIMTKSDDET